MNTPTAIADKLSPTNLLFNLSLTTYGITHEDTSRHQPTIINLV